ncbi:MAG TPA: ABC transporter ATP-binding protein [Acidimicrobiales bacterium]|nr:ABC transporter ATP-binding protein [Acidimicrobiales bacterium]
MKLEAQGIGVNFGGLRALSNVRLVADGGSVTGLIGPNGAGKTTLFNVICGHVKPSAGTVMLDGHRIDKLRPHQRARLGLGRTFQRLELFGSLTVRENVLVAAEIARRNRRRGHARPGGKTADGLAPNALADRILADVGLSRVGDVRAAYLPTGQARLVEIGRALASDPGVLLLDEPSSGLDDSETDELAGLLDRLASAGTAVLLVEHDVEMVMSICKKIYVLDFGRILTSGGPADIRDDVDVQEAYLGRRAPDADPDAAVTGSDLDRNLESEPDHLELAATNA